MTYSYNLAPVGFDRGGNLLHFAVTGNTDTCGYVTATNAGEVVRFLRATGPGPITRGCGDSYQAARASRTVAYHFTNEGCRRVRPMFWTVSRDGVVREVWSVTRKTPVFFGGTSAIRPDWTALRRAELDARREAPKETPAPIEARDLREGMTVTGIKDYPGVWNVHYAVTRAGGAIEVMLDNPSDPNEWFVIRMQPGARLATGK